MFKKFVAYVVDVAYKHSVRVSSGSLSAVFNFCCINCLHVCGEIKIYIGHIYMEVQKRSMQLQVFITVTGVGNLGVLMDQFVRDRLNEWSLSHLIPTFEGKPINHHIFQQ